MKVLTYVLVTILLSLFLIGINLFERYFALHISHFFWWIIPVFAASIVTIIGAFFWNRTHHNNILKYEFISLVTHKFRTPLTAIKWSLNLLKEPNVSEGNRQIALSSIGQSEQKLVELLEVIMNTYRSGNKDHAYKMKAGDFKDIVADILKTESADAAQRNIRISVLLPTSPLLIRADSTKIKFVLQTLLENAINYSNDNSIVTMTGRIEGSYLLCSIADKGMGIAKEDINKIFTKFYRGTLARLRDTEGLGVGLNLAKNIMVRHGGDISVQSEGVNLGTTFTMKLPLRK